MADFNLNLGQRYQLVLAKLKNYTTQQPKTYTTVASTQYYDNPAGIVFNASVSVTIGSVKYPLQTIYNQQTWDTLNAITIQPSAIPQFVFPRRDDFGIWPIPQGAYTMTLNYFWRDRNLLVGDYFTGTATVTATNATVVITGVVVAGMVGRWFTVTDTAQPGHGYWYRIESRTDATTFVLEKNWEGSAGATLAYRICETPELPEEGHSILIDGCLADFYSGLQSSPEKATWFNNKFWTGDGQNGSRDEGDESIAGGLLGLAVRYASRDDKHIIEGQPRVSPAQYKVFATTLSS